MIYSYEDIGELGLPKDLLEILRRNRIESISDLTEKTSDYLSSIIRSSTTSTPSNDELDKKADIECKVLTRIIKTKLHSKGFYLEEEIEERLGLDTQTQDKTESLRFLPYLFPYTLKSLSISSLAKLLNKTSKELRENYKITKNDVLMIEGCLAERGMFLRNENIDIKYRKIGRPRHGTELSESYIGEQFGLSKEEAEKPIEELKLTRKIKEYLRANGKTVFADLLYMSRDELEAIKGIGEKKILVIEGYLSERGFLLIDEEKRVTISSEDEDIGNSLRDAKNTDGEDSKIVGTSFSLLLYSIEELEKEKSTIAERINEKKDLISRIERLKEEISILMVDEQKLDEEILELNGQTTQSEISSDRGGISYVKNE